MATRFPVFGTGCAINPLCACKYWPWSYNTSTNDAWTLSIAIRVLLLLLRGVVEKGITLAPSIAAVSKSQHNADLGWANGLTLTVARTVKISDIVNVEHTAYTGRMPN